MASIAPSERATVKSLDFEDVLMERALGIQWCLSTDTFMFAVTPWTVPSSRRGILSVVASLYDPLGFVAPFVLLGKRTLQEMCRRNVGWDDLLPADLQPQWDMWLSDLQALNSIRIPSCFYAGSADVTAVELHHFADACASGYGTCTYLRHVTNQGVHCSLVFGQARVAPTKVVTIPRLELTAATVAAKISVMLKEELKYPQVAEYFWSDSKVVLGYIKNEGRKFHTFVANRVEIIRTLTKFENWHFVPSELNPADIASRGHTISELKKSCWFKGPAFLWESEVRYFDEPVIEIDLGDPEVKSHSFATNESKIQGSLLTKLDRFSSWTQVCKLVARLIRRASGVKDSSLSYVEEREKAGILVIKLLQQAVFQKEFQLLANSSLPKGNPLYNLDPVIIDGVMRVGGRFRKGNSPFNVRHPVILPKNCHVTNLILRHYHEQTKHCGKGFTLNTLRTNGFWVMGGARTVSSFIFRCVECRKKRRPLESQRMADLPVARIEPTPPFTHTGMDCFGPIIVKESRKVLKRYGLIFTCKCSRAIHLEVLNDMSTDCFLNALRCFIALRGPVTTLHSDQGSNFVGVANETKKALKELDPERIQSYMSNQQCDFKFNPPHSSHFGGIWERQIRTIRNILTTMLHEVPGPIDTSTLRTLLYEVMSIVNSRPLATNNLNDPTSLEPLTPNHILTMKTETSFPLPGNFKRQDLYLKKRWRRVQYLCKQFWSRWRKEYLSNIQIRSKWHKERRNLQNGYVVILKKTK